MQQRDCPDTHHDLYCHAYGELSIKRSSAVWYTTACCVSFIPYYDWPGCCRFVVAPQAFTFYEENECAQADEAAEAPFVADEDAKVCC